jgi:hypothetical protein
MTLSKFKVVAATAVAVAASVLLVAPVDAAKKVSMSNSANTPAVSSFKLENGAWVAKVVGVPMQWSYIVAADPSGRHAVGYGTIDVGVYSAGLDELIDRTSPLLIDVVLTGPGTVKFNSVWYGIKEENVGGTSATIKYIGVNKGELKFVAPGKSEGTHEIAYYWPETDGDKDGFPDPGAEPIAPPITVNSVDTRLPSP